MVPERRRRMPIVRVDHYDGQAIFVDCELAYELGGYLGGGAAGVVYEAFSARSKQPVAIKILNPVGYKLFPPALLARCLVAVRGAPVALDGNDDGSTLATAAAVPFRSPPSSRVRLRAENVWWLIHPTSKQAIAAFEDPLTGALRELTLPQCMDVWGDLPESEDRDAECRPADSPDGLRSVPIPRAGVNEPVEETGSGAFRVVQVKGQTVRLPRVPRKFQAFAKTRRLIHREVSNMSGLAFHANVLQLHAALELVQDSKCTTFLVLELATGGELFDRIKLDAGTDEQSARRYFSQLVSGVAFCHHSGVCHRDLKPENLLLADNDEPSVLKIADFGLSAIFASFADTDGSGNGNGNGNGNCGGDNCGALSSIRRLRSVVGSPHYVAPEVLMDAGGTGYDGAKADAWSIGVILYAMLAGNLPFGKDLLTCLRYDKFRKWAYQTKYSDPAEDEAEGEDEDGRGLDDASIGQFMIAGNGSRNGNADDPAADDVADKPPDVFPAWFFPSRFSFEVKSLLAQLLYPDPSMRLSVDEARRHPWVLGKEIRRARRLQSQQRASPNRILGEMATEPRGEPALFDMDLDRPPGPSRAAVTTSSAGVDASGSTKAVQPPSPFAGRMSLVVDVPPFGSVDGISTSVSSTKSTAALGVEQLRMANRVNASPVGGGGFNYAKTSSPLPPRRSPVSPDVVVSPHVGHRYLARSPHPSGVALMPPVDETVPLSSPSSSSCSSNDNKQEERTDAQLTKPDGDLDKFADGVTPSPMDENASMQSTSSSISTSSIPTFSSLTKAAVSSQTAPSARAAPPSTHHHHLHRFISPPLASSLTQPASSNPAPMVSQVPPIPTSSPPTVASDVSMARLRYRQQRRNSPPELFLRGFDRACIKIQELSAVDALALSTVDLPATIGSDSTTATAGASSDESSSQLGASESSTTSPPSYRDLVARSTRFLTTAPAPLVLARLETILSADGADRADRVAVDWDKFQLQLWRSGGARLVCTVRVFLYQRGVYLVEFRRGQVEIFQFKRFYEDVRAKMSESMEAGGRSGGGTDGAAGGGALMPLRRRHKSISGNLY